MVLGQVWYWKLKEPTNPITGKKETSGNTPGIQGKIQIHGRQ